MYDNFCGTLAGTLVTQRWRSRKAFPLGKASGTSDDDCEGSLECFSRTSTESVRGCEGGQLGVSHCSGSCGIIEAWRQWVSPRIPWSAGHVTTIVNAARVSK
jgi:hypothetical protein